MRTTIPFFSPLTGKTCSALLTFAFTEFNLNILALTEINHLEQEIKEGGGGGVIKTSVVLRNYLRSIATRHFWTLHDCNIQKTLKTIFPPIFRGLSHGLFSPSCLMLLKKIFDEANRVRSVRSSYLNIRVAETFCKRNLISLALIPVHHCRSEFFDCSKSSVLKRSMNICGLWLCYLCFSAVAAATVYVQALMPPPFLSDAMPGFLTLRSLIILESFGRLS